MRANKLFLFSNGARVFVFVAFFSFLTGTVYAEVFESSEWTHEPTYLGKISQKLGFGFLNITVGWTALFYEPAREQNFFAGVAKGIGYTFTNSVGGILHAATFPLPLDIPLPHGWIAYEYKK